MDAFTPMTTCDILGSALLAGLSERPQFRAAAVETVIAVMLNGMGSLSYGELAGERMQLGLMLHDPEKERGSWFSGRFRLGVQQ